MRYYKALTAFIRTATNLDTALDEFYQNLSSEQKIEFESAANQVPSAEAVMLLTDEINKKSSTRKSHVLAGRMRVVLEAVQQYSTIGDTAFSVHPTATLVWNSVKIVVQAALNFASYFEKLSERFAQLSTYCPRLSAYEKLFKESLRLRVSLSDFYAVVVKFCTKALEVIQQKGMKRFVKSLWKDFKGDFEQLEENISVAKEEVDEEIKLASEQKMQRIYEQLQIESKEAHTQRSQHLTEIKENRVFRSHQMLALAETKELRIQKIIKEEAGCGKTVLTGHVVEQMTKNLAGKTDTVIAYYFFDSAQKESLSPCTFLRSILHQVLRPESLNPTLQRRLEAIFIGPNGSREPDIDELETLLFELCNTQQKAIILVDGINEAEQGDQRLVLRFLKAIQQSQAVIKLFVASRPEVNVPIFFSDGQLTHINIRAHDTRLEIENFINSRVEKAKDGSLRVCGPVVIDKIKHVLRMKARGMFLWVDLQIKAICDTCEDDQTSDRVPEVLEKLPEGIIDIYSQALQRVLQKPDEQIKSVEKIFKWVVCARRPMTIDELHEALTITTGQKSWKEPSQKFSPSTVSKLCGNLIVFDDFDSTLSLAHHTVQAFLKSPPKTPALAEFSMQACKADRYLGEMCVTYLGFTDFQRSLTTTGDSRNLQCLNRPVLLTAHMLPGLNFLRLQNWNELLRRHTGGHDFDAENQLRRIRGTTNAPTVNSSFEFLEYCKTNWYHHCHAFSSEDTESVHSLKQLLKQPSLPFSWQPWGLSDDLDPFPHWPMFSWAVQQAHIPILRIWQELVTKVEANGSWEHLWFSSGDSLFASACTMANTTQIDLFYKGLIGVRPAIRPSQQQLLAGFASAAALGHITVIERLLQQKADVNAAGSDGRTALQAAAGGGHLAVVERLLQQKADVNAAAAEYNGRTALQAAAEGGHLTVVERLLQQKADVNAAAAAGYNGRTALQAAAGGGHLTVVERLLQQKADVNAAVAAGYNGRTALQAAAEGGHLTVVERLLQQKADVNAAAAEYDGRTALQAAAEGGHLAVVERLLQQKADVNAAAAAEYNGRTALQAAAEDGHLAVVERLLQQKADVNAAAAEYDGRTALQAAAEGGHLAVVERLLQQKVDVNAAAADAEYKGRTALQAAAEGGHLAVVERLRIAGAR